MYKQMTLQSLYQTAVTLVFHFLGSTILTSNMKYDLTVQTLVFNAFVFARLFTWAWDRGWNWNICERVLKNYYFTIVITLIEIGTQIFFVLIGSQFLVTPIGGLRQWDISLFLGIVSIPLGALIRLMLSEAIKTLFKWVGLL
ncbi:hypothetical protein GGX14DRAFT_325401, partial [Mycena pura]